MNPITEALQQGHSEDEVLNFVYKAYPHLNKKIESAKKAGYSINAILKFLSGMSANQSSPQNATQQEAIKFRRQNENEKFKNLALTGASALGGGLLARAGIKYAPQIMSGVKDLFGKGNQIPKDLAQQTATSPVQQALTPNTPQNAPMPPQIPSEALPGKPSKKEIDNTIDTHLQALMQQVPKITPRETNLVALNVSKKFNLPIQEAQQLVRERTSKEDTSLSKDSLIRQGQNVRNPPLSQIKPPEVPEAIKKEKITLLPDGEIGTLKGEKQGIAQIELANGKTRNQKIVDLIEAPEDAAEIAQELIKKITPETGISKQNAASYYDEDDKEAYFIFHNGEAYKVEDISPEEYHDLSNETVHAKTSGGTSWGQWNVGEGSRGAAYNQIIKGKNKPYKKLKLGYDMFQTFRKQVHENEKRRKKEEKLKRKRDEDL